MTRIPATLPFERIPAPGLIVDRAGTVLAVNEAACATLDRQAEALVGLSLASLFVSGGQELIASATGIHVLQLDAGPRRITLQCAVSEIELDGQAYLQIFGIDISSRADAEEQARARAGADEQSATKQRLESLGIVAGGIAHDFNNLLVGVLAESSAAREDITLPERTQEALRRIEAGAQRMAQLTRSMLAYSGRGRFVAKHLDPDELLGELRDVFARTVRADVVLAVHSVAGHTVIEADASMLRQVMLNLVANASDAGARHVTVATCVVLRENAPWWQLEVSDDGVGIDAATITRIFEPFFTTKTDRHGLGLSAVHGIVRRLGGEIEVDSTPGDGARFRVRVPVLQGATAHKHRATTGIIPIPFPLPLSRLSELRVLVADDEPSVRATVRRLLERRGATVVVACDGAEAEARLAEASFDLVIADVSMPGRGGYDVLATARALQPGVPVVLMSGYTSRVRGEGGEEEPDVFLEKPFTSRTMDTALDDVMKRKGG